VGRYGTNLEGFGAFEGGVNADKGAPLVSTSSDGETSLLFGPAALREIQAGVANGDFAIPPDEGDAIITSENPLPYWTFTDTNSNGAISCKIVDDASSGSSNTLRWSIAAASANSLSAKLTRFIPVASTRNRAFAYAPEVNTFGATNTANSTIRMQAQYYKADQTTTTGTAIDSGALTFATMGTGSNYLIGAFTTALAAPADAAFCLVTITVATAAAGAVVASTIDIPEVRLIRGDQTNLFAEYTTPGTYSPTRVRQVNGTLNIEPNGGTGNVTLGGDLTVSGNDINLGTGFTISGVGTSAVQFTRNDSGNRANITVARVFPGTQGTRYMDDDGTRTTFSAGIDVNADSTLTSATFSSSISASDYSATTTGTAFAASNGGDVLVTGADTSVPISGNGELSAIPNTTTATTNSARWVLISGSRYGLRRDSSTRRVKTNIVQADEGVLAAAKRLRAVHFEPLEKDADGNLRGTGQLTLGLIAEEIVEAGLGCAVTYDGEGLPDGYDERVIIAALLHRINDLEQRLADLEAR
jgi:hypothetical protein